MLPSSGSSLSARCPVPESCVLSYSAVSCTRVLLTLLWCTLLCSVSTVPACVLCVLYQEYCTDVYIKVYFTKCTEVGFMYCTRLLYTEVPRCIGVFQLCRSVPKCPTKTCSLSSVCPATAPGTLCFFPTQSNTPPNITYKQCF